MPYFRPKTLSPSATYRSLPSLAIYRDAAVLSMPSIAVLCRSGKGNASAPTCPASSSGKRCVQVAWAPIDSMTALSEADIGRGISSCRCCVPGGRDPILATLEGDSPLGGQRARRGERPPAQSFASPAEALLIEEAELGLVRPASP